MNTKITGFTIKPTSNEGYSLLESNEKRGICPEVSIQLPTEFAEELKRRWELVEKMEVKALDKVFFQDRGNCKYVVIYVSPDKKTCHIENTSNGFLWKDVLMEDVVRA